MRKRTTSRTIPNYCSNETITARPEEATFFQRLSRRTPAGHIATGIWSHSASVVYQKSLYRDWPYTSAPLDTAPGKTGATRGERVCLSVVGVERYPSPSFRGRGRFHRLLTLIPFPRPRPNRDLSLPPAICDMP